MVRIEVEDHATPLVSVLAATLRRAADDPKLARKLSRLRGSFGLKSTVDPQAATIHFDRGRIRVTRGAAKADATLLGDLDKLSGPDAAKPKVKGALRHPLLVLGAAKVLEPPVPGGWRGAAEAFWRAVEHRPDLPRPLRVVSLDDGSDLRLGGDGDFALEIHGSAEALIAVFVGNEHPGEAWQNGRIFTVGDLRAIFRFVGVGQAVMFGEAR